MKKFLFLTVWLLLSAVASVPANAQDATSRAVILSLQLQKAGVEAQNIAELIQSLSRRIAELEKLCGEPCKPKPPPTEGEK